MELIFKKYRGSELHTEKNYLIYDPAHNGEQFTDELFRSIAHRNFTQGCESLLIGPIMDGKRIRVKALSRDGREISVSSGAMKIFEAYLTDQGYDVGADASVPTRGSVREFGTVYYFPA